MTWGMDKEEEELVNRLRNLSVKLRRRAGLSLIEADRLECIADAEACQVVAERMQDIAEADHHDSMEN